MTESAIDGAEYAAVCRNFLSRHCIDALLGVFTGSVMRGAKERFLRK